MDQQDNQAEKEQEMLDNNIKQFIAAARQHFFGLLPAAPLVPVLPQQTLN